MFGWFGPAPIGALFFGFAGLLPFWATALGVHLFARGGMGLTANTELSQFCAQILVLWGGLILAFLGGTRWGRAVGPHHVPTEDGDGAPGLVTFASASFPSVIAWIGVAVSLPPVNLVVLGASVLVGGFAHMLLWDLQGVREGVWPKWYSALRVILTALAGVALIVGGVGAIQLG